MWRFFSLPFLNQKISEIFPSLSQDDKWSLRLVSTIFYQIFISHQMIAFQKLWKMFFISTKKLFSFLRYSDICISFFTSFSVCQPLLLRLFKDKSKVYDVINCLNKNLITHFVWYLEKEIRCDIETLSIDRVLNKEHFHGKTMQKMCTKSYPQAPF